MFLKVFVITATSIKLCYVEKKKKKKTKKDKNKSGVLINMITIPPCDLPMVPLAAEKRSGQGFLVTTGKNGTNSTIGRFAYFTIGRIPNVAIVNG